MPPGQPLPHPLPSGEILAIGNLCASPPQPLFHFGESAPLQYHRSRPPESLILWLRAALPILLLPTCGQPQHLALSPLGTGSLLGLVGQRGGLRAQDPLLERTTRDEPPSLHPSSRGHETNPHPDQGLREQQPDQEGVHVEAGGGGTWRG